MTYEKYIAEANYLLIRKYWNQRNDPKIRNKIISLLSEIKLLGGPYAQEAERQLQILEQEQGAPQPKNTCGEESTFSTFENSNIKVIPNRTIVQQVNSTPSFLITEKPSVSFSDIGGLQDVKEKIKLEVIFPRKNRQIYELYGRSVGCGILLWGPPGCGKTLMAKAIASECGLPFFSISTSDIMSKWVGESEKKVAEIFGYAKKVGECIIFFDELEELIPRSGPSYIRRIRNVFREQLDGISSKKEGLLVLGATNEPWRIDPAMRRPGRFSELIFIPPPDHAARVQIFKLNLKQQIQNGILSDDVDFDKLASMTKGMSGADIAKICRSAVDIPLKEAVKGSNPRKIVMKDFETAISKTKPSIIPWIIKALEAVKKYKAEEFRDEIMKIAGTYIDTKKGKENENTKE